MARKRRKIKKSWLIILVLSVLLILSLSFILNNPKFIGKKSVHADAKKYQTRHCLAFYPDGDNGLKMAKEVCKDVKDDSIFDYSLIPFGDYYMVNYGHDLRYLTDKEYNTLKIETVSEKEKGIITDYLKYEIKKDNPEKYYDPEYIKTLKTENIDFSNIKYSIDGESLSCYLPDYDKTLSIPLNVAQRLLDMNFGFADSVYRKPVYIDPDRPVICLTFDDGPQFWYESGDTSTEVIVDVLAEYDANATFYVVGDNLENRVAWSDYEVYDFFKKSIANGNEYGSHTQTHKSTLTDLSTKEAIYKEINEPIEFMRKFISYDMNTYRPVAGEFDDDVLNAQPVGAVLWDLDSEDWLSMDSETIIDRVLNSEIDSGDILIFHDIYDETADALKTIIPELLSRGYQMVTVSDMMNYYGVDVNNFKFIFSATDYR